MAELLAAGAALGVASSIFTFADVGWRIIKRVDEFVAAAGHVPAVLADIKAQLPLLIEKMDQLKALGEERLQKIEPQSALAEAVTGCRLHVDRLEELVNKLQPQATDSRSKRARKGTQSVLYEDEISKILIKLEGYKTSFILYFTNISVDLDKATRRDESYYVVPFLQVSDYIKRVDLLESVETVVQQMKEQQRRQVVVLLGMGGQGKSQLAMEYCRIARTSREFRAIFWIDASSIRSVKRGFESIASKIGGPSRTFRNMEEKVAFVKDTMEGWESRWLLVFDNYDTPGTDFNVASFFPSSSSGTILVTSRHEDSKRLGKVIRLTKMTEDESLELLLRRSENERTDESTKTGKLIVAKLGFLPLAIDQAGAFIGAQKLPLTLFLKEFELKKEDILKYTPSLTEYRRALDDDEKETALNVFTTWEFSFQQIHGDETGERLRLFLTTASFFDAQEIGEDLFRGANDLKTVPSWVDVFVSEGRWDNVKYRKALAELSNLSLLNLAIDDTEQCHFYLHPLVADWLRLRTVPEKRRIYTIESCYLLAKLIKNTDIDSCSYAFRLYLLKHLDECLKNKKAYLKLADEDAELAKIFSHKFGSLLRETSRYREALSLSQEALPIIESAYGKDHQSALDTVHELANLYVDLGMPIEAQEMYERVLLQSEKTLGKDHQSTLITVHNLARLYTKLGRLTEAQEMYERVILESEKTLGKDHQSTLITVHNLARLYTKLGRLTEAQEMYERVLLESEKTLGKDHQSTLNTVHNLARLYVKLGRLTEAQEMYERVLLQSEKTLGKDHQSTLDTVHGLANLYVDLGKLTEAQEMYERVLLASEKTLGKDHQSTLDAVYELANVYVDLGRLTEAQEMYERVLFQSEKTLGKDHQSNLDTVRNLANLYTKLGRLTEAQEMYERVLLQNEKTPGKGHESTLTTIFNIGLLMEKREDLEGARQMFENAFFGYRNLLGTDDSATIKAQNCLQRVSRLQHQKANENKGFWKSLRKRLK